MKLSSIKTGTFVYPTVFLLAFLLAWQIVVDLEFLDALILPPPGDVGLSLVALLSGGLIWDDLWVTTWTTLVGFVIAAVGGIGLAILTGLSQPMRAMLYPYVIALQVTPRIALAPILIAWLGFGESPRIAVAALIAFFPIFVNTLTGIFSAGVEEEEMFRSLGASRSQLFTNLMLPASLPMIFAALKTAMTLALTGAVVGEFIAADKGLGLLVKRFSYQLNMDDAFAVLVLLMILGLVLYAATALMDTLVVFWNHDRRMLRRSEIRALKDSRRSTGPGARALQIPSQSN